MQNRSNRNENRRPYSSRGSFSSREESRWSDSGQRRGNFSSENEDETMRDYNMENSSPRRDFDFESGTRQRYGQGNSHELRYEADRFRDTEWNRDRSDRESDSSPSYGSYSRDYSSQNYSDRDPRGSQSYGGARRNLREESYGSERSERSQRKTYEGRGPKSYSRSDDRIKEDICEMLTRNAEIDANDIDVEVKEGEVTLSGTVSDRRMKHLAEDLVERTYSVKDVTNNIRVQREATHDWSTQSEMGSNSDVESSSSSSKSETKSGKKSSH
ncbi:BON domain-containing protein [Bdellovibrio sp. HCB274]|uniref:BON domain-containing protein n=1 Tax=Bdellovibrio sp. HCB274 TaxID=3394361 RepID=UPI0039B5F968